jgi:hypothetical protein
VAGTSGDTSQPTPKLAALAVAGSVGSGLSEARTRADLGSFREELSGRRRAIGPPLS